MSDAVLSAIRGRADIIGRKADIVKCLLLTQSGHSEAGPRSTSIAAGFGLSSRAQSFTYAQQYFHMHPAAFPSRENDYVRTIFISYPAQDHRSRTRRAGSVALRAAGSMLCA